jgi:hypothetical protein
MPDELLTTLHQDFESREGDKPPAIPYGMEEAAQQRAAYLKARLEAYISGQGRDQERLYKSFKDFLSINDRIAYPWQSNILLPISYNAILAIWSRIMESILGAPKLAKVTPWAMAQGAWMPDYEELEFQARLADGLFNASLEQADTRADWTAGSLDSLIFGRNWSKCGWMTKGRPDGFGGMDVISEFPKGVRVSPWNVYKDPYCGRDVQRARDIHEILELTYEDILALSRSNMFIPDAIQHVTEAQSGTGLQYRQRANDLRFNYSGDCNTGYYEIVESWHYWDPDGNGVPTLWVTWWDWQTGEVLGCRECPFEHGEIPYHLGVPTIIPDQSFGISVAEALHAIQTYSSATVNQLAENLAAMNMRHIVLEGALDEVALQRSIPNGIIHAQDINAHKPLMGQAMPPDVWRFLDFWEDQKQQTSGVTPLTMAMRAASTAYGTSTVQANAQQLFDRVTSVLTTTWLRGELRQSFANLQQFQDIPLMVKVEGLDGASGMVPVDRHSIAGNFQVEPFDLRLYGRKVQRAQTAQALLAQMVQVQLPANYQWIVSKIFEDLELYDVDEAFKGQIWNPIAEQAKAAAQANAPPMQPMGGGEPKGVAGQWTPNEVQPPQVSPDASRVQIRPMPGGAMPVSLQGLLGGGEA